MVYFEASDLDYGPNLKNWLNTLPKEFPAIAFELINELVEFSLKRGFAFFEKRKTSTSFPFHKHNVLNTMFALMSGFIRFFQKNGGFGDNDQPTAGNLCSVHQFKWTLDLLFSYSLRYQQTT
jgi:hypothetical protein